MRKTNFKLVQEMHEKFEISNTSGPSSLSKPELDFRCKAIFEELVEYMSASYENIQAEKMIENWNLFIKDLKRNDDPDLAAQFDALIDIGVFTIGSAERQGFNWDCGFGRVMSANIQKELAGTSTASKRGFKRDLVKPRGWQPPELSDLVEKQKGIIVLEGPDGSGKSTIAEYIKDTYGATIIHHTWSPWLEENMQQYHIDGITKAIHLAENELVILDRSWISELIYSHVFRDGSNWPSLHELGRNLLKQNNAAYILCLPNDLQAYIKHFEQLCSNRNEMFTNSNLMKSVWLEYYCLFMIGPMSDNLPQMKGVPFEAQILKEGGLQNATNMIRYDFMNDCIERTIQEALGKMK